MDSAFGVFDQGMVRAVQYTFRFEAWPSSENWIPGALPESLQDRGKAEEYLTKLSHREPNCWFELLERVGDKAWTVVFQTISLSEA